jgi:hypothetical protein
MQSRLKISSLLALTAAFTSAHAQYKIEFLPKLTPGSGTFAMASNPSGTAVGYEVRPDGTFKGVVWKGNTITELPSSADAVALDISDNDIVIGYGHVIDGTGVSSIVWQNGIPTKLPGVGFDRFALGINDAGTLIVGHIKNDRGYQPVVWEGETVRELATPTGNGGVAYDVNNDGDIVGYYVGKDSEIVPCVWRKGVPLPLISEVTHVAPNIITNTGNVVASGTIVRNDADGNAVYVSVGAIFTATGDVQLIERGLKTSIDLSDITDSGIAVGYLKSYENETPYEGAGIFEGSDFTPLPSGDSPFTKPTSIADDGTVFGFAIDTSTDTIGAVRWTRQGDRLRMNVGLGWPGDQVPVEAKVLLNGKPVANRRVTFQVDGKNAGTGVTDATGTARTTYQIPTTLSKGKQEFMGSLGGSNYVLKMVSVNKFPTRVNTMMATGKPGGQVSLRAALQNTKTGAWTANQTIVFMLGGKEFARAKTDSRGIATHQYKLARSVKPGTYTLKARYLGNATHLPFERNLTLGVTAP